MRPLSSASSLDPAPRLAAIAVQIQGSAGRGAQRPPMWARALWILDLSARPEAFEEAAACARWMEESTRCYASRGASADGACATYFLTGAAASPADARSLLRGLPVAFAALSSWGCGPVAGARAHDADERWSAQEIESAIARAELASASPEPASAARRSPRRV